MRSFIIKPLSITLVLLQIACNKDQIFDKNKLVDTTDKTIDFQIKKIYEFNKIGVFVSNKFDGARLNKTEQINDSTISIFISPENTPINNSPYFAFKTWSTKEQIIYFKISYPDEFKHRYFPKVKKGNKWNTIDSTNVTSTERTLLFKIKINSEAVTIAAQPVINSTDVKSWYDSLPSVYKNIVHLKYAGKTVLKKDIPVLELFKDTKTNKPTIVLLTRQHPPEVTGYFAFKEFLMTILNQENTKTFFDKFNIIAFPIANPDGVDLGHWRHNAHGVDLNRDWEKYNQPEIKQVVSFINTYALNNNARIILGLDFHSTFNDVFYTNVERQSTALPNFLDNWFKDINQNIPNYKVNEKSAKSKQAVSKAWFLNNFNAVGITYEIGDNTSLINIKKLTKNISISFMNILLNSNIN